MGRGSSGSKGPGGSWREERSAVGHDGNQIDLSDSPLKYSGDERGLSGVTRERIEDFERKRVKNKIEYGRTVDANGNIIEENKGGRGSVRISTSALNRADVFSHNHPRSESPGMLGGTFSEGDLSSFTSTRVRVFRAAASEGTYSIAKQQGFDGNGLKRYYRDVVKRAEQEHSQRIAAERQAYRNLSRDYRQGKVSYAQVSAAWDAYNAVQSKSFNKCLVDMHNGLIEGQKHYGYTYTLERRKA